MRSLFSLIALAACAVAAPATTKPSNNDDGYRIVGGEPVGSIDTYPWITSITDYGSHQCGGSMIAPNMVLTAAHCTGGSTRRKQVSCWRYDITKPTLSEKSIDFEVLKMIKHPNYTSGPDGTPLNDVAIWVLKQKANHGSRQVPLASISTDPTEPHGAEPVRIIGWGTTSQGGRLADELMQVDVEVIDNEKCTEAYSRYPGSIVDSTMCAGFAEGGKDTCQGDSGGPLFREVDGKAVLYGITSWGEGCAQPGKPGVYTRVGSFASWIQETVDKYSAYDGSDEPSEGGSDSDWPIVEEDPWWIEDDDDEDDSVWSSDVPSSDDTVEEDQVEEEVPQESPKEE